MASNSNRRSGSSGRSPKSGRGPGGGSSGGRATRGRGADRQRSGTQRSGAGARIAAEKRAEREQRLAAKRARTRKMSLLWIGGAAAIIAACLTLFNSTLFPVSAVEVTGNERLTADEVIALADVPADATLLRFPADAVSDRVAANPWVASVSVSRDFPDTMQIRIEERKPAALVDIVDSYLLVDSDGFIIENRSLEETTTLVVIRDLQGIDPTPGRRSTSEGLHNALAILSGLSDELRGMVGAISVASIDETALLTNDGVEVFFGTAEDISKKDAVAVQILEEQAGKVVFVDVRVVDRPIWRGLEQ